MKTLKSVGEWLLLIAVITGGLALAALVLEPVDAAMQPQHVFRSTT